MPTSMPILENVFDFLLLLLFCFIHHCKGCRLDSLKKLAKGLNDFSGVTWKGAEEGDLFAGPQTASET